jgi:hypothetical protein
VNTKAQGLSRTLTIVGASAALALLAVPTVSTASPGAVPLGDYTCSDGSHISPVAKDVPGFMHTQVGFVNGRAVAPRWFSGAEEGTVTITSGAYKGDRHSYTDSFSGPANGRRATEPDLGALTECSSGPVEDAFSITVDQQSLDVTGIDSKYLGATADIVAVREFAVYLQPGQLTHRRTTD